MAVPEDLAERVMHRVRDLARGEPGGVLVAEDRGQTRVADIVLARVARATALTVPGVVWASVVSAGEHRDGVGEVRVSVVTKVAGIAAREVAGVYALGGTGARAIGSVTQRVGIDIRVRVSPSRSTSARRASR